MCVVATRLPRESAGGVSTRAAMTSLDRPASGDLGADDISIWWILVRYALRLTTRSKTGLNRDTAIPSLFREGSSLPGAQFPDSSAVSMSLSLYSADSDGTQRYSQSSAWGYSSTVPRVTQGSVKTSGSMIVISASIIP